MAENSEQTSLEVPKVWAGRREIESGKVWGVRLIKWGTNESSKVQSALWCGAALLGWALLLHETR